MKTCVESAPDMHIPCHREPDSAAATAAGQDGAADGVGVHADPGGTVMATTSKAKRERKTVIRFLQGIAIS